MCTYTHTDTRWSIHLGHILDEQGSHPSMDKVSYKGGSCSYQHQEAPGSFGTWTICAIAKHGFSGTVQILEDMWLKNGLRVNRLLLLNVKNCWLVIRWLTMTPVYLWPQHVMHLHMALEQLYNTLCQMGRSDPLLMPPKYCPQQKRELKFLDWYWYWPFSHHIVNHIVSVCHYLSLPLSQVRRAQ